MFALLGLSYIEFNFGPKGRTSQCPRLKAGREIREGLRARCQSTADGSVSSNDVKQGQMLEADVRRSRPRPMVRDFWPLASRPVWRRVLIGFWGSVSPGHYF